MKDYYEVLGLPETATAEQIKRKYRTLVREYHTDVTDYPKFWAEERVKAINTAYEVLGDETRRAAYDAQRQAEATRQQAAEAARRRSTEAAARRAATQAESQAGAPARGPGACWPGGARSAASPSQTFAGGEAPRRARESKRRATTRRVLRPWGRVVLAVTVATVSAPVSALPLLAWWWWRAELAAQRPAATGLLLGAGLAHLVTGWWYPCLLPFARELVLCRLLAGTAFGATLGVVASAHSVTPPPSAALYTLCCSLGSLVGLTVNGAVLLRRGAQASWPGRGGFLTSMREGAQGALVVALGAALLVGGLQGELESVGLVAVMLGGLGLGVGLLTWLAAGVVMPVLDQLNGWLLKVAGRIEECPEGTL
jgi:hypothetical protein